MVNFQVSRILARPIFSIGRPHNDTRINGSNVSSFNRLLQSLFSQLCFKDPRSHVLVLAKPKLQSMPSRSCVVKIARVIRIWECGLECQDWSPTMFLYANCSHCVLWHAILGEAFIVSSGNLHIALLWSAPPHDFSLKNNKIIKYLWRPKWHLIGVEDFNTEHYYLKANKA